MARTKRYYWLKLPEKFFDDDAIEWLEEQENGKTYCLFYLKLCLKAINSEGILVRKVGSVLIPYEPSKLAEITKTPVDTVIIALKIFKTIGLMQIFENGEIFLPRVPEMVGSETSDAIRMRKSRDKKLNGSKAGGEQCSHNVLTMSVKRSPDIEKELLLLRNNNNSFDKDNLITSDKCEMPTEFREKVNEMKKKSKY